MTLFRRVCMMCLRDLFVPDFSYPEGLRLQICKSCMSKGESEIPHPSEPIASLPPEKRRTWLYCPFCGKEISSKDKICPKCGPAIPEQTPREVALSQRCTQCRQYDWTHEMSYQGNNVWVCKSCMVKYLKAIKDRLPPPKKRKAWRDCPFCQTGIRKKDRICPQCGVAIAQDVPREFPKVSGQRSEDQEATDLDGVGSHYEHARYKSEHKD